MSIRDEMCHLARGFDGLTARDAAFGELIAPHETAQVRSAMLSGYTCGNVVRGLWRLIGVKHSVLENPYRIGHAMSDVVEIARSKGAWVVPTGDTLPGRGDVVLVGGDKVRDGGVEHVFTVLDARWYGTVQANLDSVDGGQLREGAQAISQRERVWTRRLGRWIDQAVDASVSRSRAVQGWCDLEKVLT